MEYGTKLCTINLLDKTHLLCSTDELRPALTGLYINGPYCFASDSFTANTGRVEYDEAYQGENNFECILPIEIVNQYWKTKKKATYPRIEIYESRNEHNQKQLLAVCDDLAKWCIDEKFPPLTDTIYYFGLMDLKKSISENKHKEIRLNPSKLAKIAESLGNPKGEVNILLTESKQAYIYTDSTESGKNNLGLLMLCRNDERDFSLDFWAKEMLYLQSPERQTEMHNFLEKKNSEEALREHEKKITEAENEENRYMLEYIKKYYEEVFEEAEAHITNKNAEELEVCDA
jgi:hypothetical protein